MSWIKNQALLILGGLVTVLVFLLSIFGWRTQRLKTQRDKFKATAKKQREVMEADVEIEEQTRSRRADALNEIKKGNAPDAFLNPGRMRDKPD